MCVVIIGVFPKPPGRRSKPGLFANLLRGCLYSNMIKLIGLVTYPLAFLVGNFSFLIMCVHSRNGH